LVQNILTVLELEILVLSPHSSIA